MVAVPSRDAWELAGDDHFAKGERVRRLVDTALSDAANVDALREAAKLTYELAAVVNYYANEGDGGADTVQNEIEGVIDAVDIDDVEPALRADLEETLTLLNRGGWQVERGFPGYGWRLEEFAGMVLADLVVFGQWRTHIAAARTEKT